jgi:hypothetical protein
MDNAHAALTQPVAEGPDEELVALLAVGGNSRGGAKLSPEQCRRAADTIRQAIRLPMLLPADVARCPGLGFWEDGEYEWREGCDDCLRRTSPGGRVTVKPPAVIAFECEYRIGPGEVAG